MMHKGSWLRFLVILSLGCSVSFAQQDLTLETAEMGVVITTWPVSGAGEEDKLDFVSIPAGEFMMGEENALHRVRFSKDFEMMKYEVTQGQWEATMGSNPSRFQDCGSRCPVENVSWNDIQSFISKLNSRGDGWRYRLPTEAEWEYAARAGSTGDFAGNLDEMGWYGNTADRKTYQVGQKKPNAWGLHDMHGNVWEWVNDWFGDYSPEAVTDPTGPSSGSDRVSRGGGYGNEAKSCRSANRKGRDSGYRRENLGFRIVRIR